MGYKINTNTIKVEEELLNKLSIMGLEIALPKDDDEDLEEETEEDDE